MALNIPSEDPLSFVGDQTANILKQIEQSTTILPVSTIIWPTEDTPSKNTTQSFAQFWGKRAHESEPTNMEMRHVVKEEKPYFSPSSTYGKPKEELHIDSKITTNSGKQKRRKLTTEEKSQKRKQQTRAASKLYRQRRKALETQLSERLDIMEKEKNALAREKKAADDMLQKLQAENQSLRQTQKYYSEENAKKRLNLLVKLQDQVNSAATDDVLCGTISDIKQCCRSCMELGQCNLQSIINPNVVQQLVQSGFFESTVKSELCNQQSKIEDLVTKLKTEVRSLSTDQLNKIDNIVIYHTEKLEVILTERNSLAEEISKTFQLIQSQGSDSKDYLEIVGSLEHLRKSLSDEAKLWKFSMNQVIDETLTPLQVAQFYLKVEFTHASVRQLGTFWAALNKTFTNEC